MSAASNLLVVDDEPRLRKTLALILRKNGYQVSTAPDGCTALQVLSENSFDLMILDWQLPDVRGISMLADIRRLYPNLPVIVVTGDGSDVSAEMVMQLGGSSFLMKPFDPRTMIHLVGDLLKPANGHWFESNYYNNTHSSYSQL